MSASASTLTAEQVFNLAVQHQSEGRLDEARNLYDKLLDDLAPGIRIP